MNKNDLRYQKTEILIRETYLKLKKHGSTNVKVTELCERAMINKTTFYAHYETMENLHKKICLKLVESMLSQCSDIEMLRTNTQDFVCSLLDSFLDNMSTVEKLYGDDLYALVNDVELVLFESYLPKDFDDNDTLAIRFCIGGAFRLLVTEKNPLRVHKTIELIEKVLKTT